jgi:hypothetical protein
LLYQKVIKNDIMKTNPRYTLHPGENEPQTDYPTKKQIGRSSSTGKEQAHEPPVARADTDYTKNTARFHGLNEELTDANERETLN